MIAGKLGGNNNPNEPETVINPNENERLYPSLINKGINNPPNANIVTPDPPVNAVKKPHNITIMTGVPPGIHPNNSLNTFDNQKKTMVYLSNSLKPGRIFGDPFTGQISCYSTVFGKFDYDSRLVIAYFPHQSFSQFMDSDKNKVINKGFTLMRELVDFIVLGGGVVIKFNSTGRAKVI